MKEIEPWGVNVPFLLLGLSYWFLGGMSLTTRAPLNIAMHPFFMMIGAYSIYFGMFQRLFFPAKNYIMLQLASLILLSVPIYPFQAFASISLAGVELWGIKDVKSYGSRFPVNWLVLLSPFASAVAWFIYPEEVWALTVPLLLYLLGINVGVFSATLGLKPKFGWKQIPIIGLAIATGFLPKLLPALMVFYVIWLILGTRKVNLNVTAITFLLSPLVALTSSLFLGEEFHAFALGLMAPFFFGCIAYSTSRYNYGKMTPVPALLLIAYLVRPLDLGASSIFFVFATVYFLFMIRGNLTLTTVKTGMSARYVSPHVK